jgi:CheY-like chemotaxis protein
LEDELVVLVVEDDAPIQAVIEDALSEGGFEPAIVPSGEEAVTLLQGGQTHYRALVIDIGLRGRMDGWEVAKYAREIDGALPVIYITAAGQAVCAGSACHRSCPATQYRAAGRVTARPRWRPPS